MRMNKRYSIVSAFVRKNSVVVYGGLNMSDVDILKFCAERRLPVFSFWTSDVLGDEVAGGEDIVELVEVQPVSEKLLRSVATGEEGDQWVIVFDRDASEVGEPGPDMTILAALLYTPTEAELAVQRADEGRRPGDPHYIVELRKSSNQSSPPPGSEYWNRPATQFVREVGKPSGSPPDWWPGVRYSHVIIYTPPEDISLLEFARSLQS